ncbi:type II CAAX prenyl endopeptidase Rce1 family protein [Actinomadura sp. 21ATH]|uniref:CPBP family glutamic-type intramembrane protease n=1 Tax=Actinomadura sp. 21ATH TaxID=1735444 RepID=UPI0035BF9778
MLAVLTYAKVVRWSERRAPVEVAAKDARAGLGRGTLIGVGMFTAVIAIIAVFGGYRIDGFGSVGGLVSLLGMMATVAVTEELVFRGILFRIVEDRTGTWLDAGGIRDGILLGRAGGRPGAAIFCVFR